MATVYSNRLIEEKGLSGPATFVVPAGYIAVIRDLDVYYGNQLFPAYARLIGAANQKLWSVSNSIGSESYAQWRGRQVFLAGETITVSVDEGGEADVTLSGYLLIAP